MRDLFFPLPAIAIGAYAAYSAGYLPNVFLPNLAGVVIGLLLVWSFRFRPRESRIFDVGFVIAFFLLSGATFFVDGMDGVSRWVPFGPFSLNVAMAFEPLLLFCLGNILVFNPRAAVALAAANMAIHYFQPDAGQSTAFGFAFIALLIFRRRSIGANSNIKILGIALSLLMAIVLTWLKPDPLPAFDQVEGILHLIAKQGMFMSVLAALAVLLLALPVFKVFYKKRSILSSTFLIYFVVQFLVTEFGAFPVPVVGAGISPVLGWYAILAILANEKA